MGGGCPGGAPGKLRAAARHLFRDSRPPTEAEAAALGLTVDEATPRCDVWPDNVQSLNVFIAMLTQWRAGAMGLIGLDYAALPVVLDLNAVPQDDRSMIFEDIRAMEDAALAVMRQKNG